jgi:hypothetical protein
MLREMVVEEETPGDFQTTFRLRVDGTVIAKNVTESVCGRRFRSLG